MTLINCRGHTLLFCRGLSTRCFVRPVRRNKFEKLRIGSIHNSKLLKEFSKFVTLSQFSRRKRKATHWALVCFPQFTTYTLIAIFMVTPRRWHMGIIKNASTYLAQEVRPHGLKCVPSSQRKKIHADSNAKRKKQAFPTKAYAFRIMKSMCLFPI